MQEDKLAFSLKELQHILSKEKDAIFTVKTLEHLFTGITPKADKEEIYLITKILTYQLKQKGVNAFYIFKIFLNRVFIQLDPLYLNIFRNTLKEIHTVKFKLPNIENSINFEIDNTQLTWFFKNQMSFINGFCHYLTSADNSLLSWLHYYFWEPFEDHWLQLLKIHKTERKRIQQSWVLVINNYNLEPVYRSYGIKALCVLKPSLSFFEKRKIGKFLKTLNFEDRCTQKLIASWKTL